MDDSNIPRKAHLRVKNGKRYYELNAVAYRKFFLLEVSEGELEWCKASQFEVEDKPIPQFWLYKVTDNTIRSNKYKDKLIKSEIWGPEEFVNNIDFLLDIDYRDSKAAFEYAMQVKEKYDFLLENKIDSSNAIEYINSDNWVKKYL